MGANQARKTLERRERIRAHIAAHEGGVTSEQIGQALNLSDTAIRTHTRKLIAAGLVEYQKNPHSCFASGSLPGVFGAPGFAPKFPLYEGGSTKMRIAFAARLADDFYGRRIAPAVQIGIPRHWMDVALFGAGSAA